jgi:hypothetical protein
MAGRADRQIGSPNGCRVEPMEGGAAGCDTLGVLSRPGAVIMHARDPAEAVEVLNLLLKSLVMASAG